jgi:predicted alpha/beta-fold hydrolase
MRRITQRALEAGLGVIRLNVRNCGGTERHSPTLYHSGLTADLRRIVEQLAPQPLLIVGFSMGGNIVLKLAGEWAENFPRHVKAVCGISVPVQLGASARRLGEARNRVYEVRFLRVLRRTLETKRRLMPELFGRLTRDRIASIYEFDDRITAPAFGFRDADDYYARCSSAAYLAKVRVPALLLQADDDPFIPAETYDDPVFDQNPNLQLIRTPHGGHVAFLAKAAPRFWAEFQALRFFQAALGVCPAEKRKKYWNV